MKIKISHLFLSLLELALGLFWGYLLFSYSYSFFKMMKKSQKEASEKRKGKLKEIEEVKKVDDENESTFSDASENSDEETVSLAKEEVKKVDDENESTFSDASDKSESTFVSEKSLNTEKNSRLKNFWKWGKRFYFVFGLYVIHLFNKYSLNSRKLANFLRLNSVHIFGRKGRGKDLLTQTAIIKNYKARFLKIVRREKLTTPEKKKAYFDEKPLYLANIDYGYGGKVINITDLFLGEDGRPLTYNDFLNGDVLKMNIKKKEDYEGLDFVLSDGNVYVPSSEHFRIDKLYPWLPIFFQLSRQLYNMNITLNSQEYIRIWKKLRGLTDIYIVAKSVTPANKSVLKRFWQYVPFLRDYLFFTVKIYDRQASAIAELEPIRKKQIGFWNNLLAKLGVDKVSETMREIENANRGMVKKLNCMVLKKEIYYDSRVFHNIIFKQKFSLKGKKNEKNTT